jgi:hypothetical protein
VEQLVDHRFWNNEMNVAILRGARATYSNFKSVAHGLHVSTFQLDHATALDRLQRIVDGTLLRSSVLCAPWRGVEARTLAGVLRVLRQLDEGPDGNLSLALVTKVFYDDQLPNTLWALQGNVLRALGRCAPVMLVSTGATESSIGERLVYGERLIFHRPTELLPVLSLYSALSAHEASVINRQLASLASLPLAELQAMAGSTEAKKVLIAAVSHLSSKRRVAKFHNISVGTVARAEAAVSNSLIQLGEVHDQVYARLAEERTMHESEAAELAAAAQAAREQGKSVRVINELEHRAKVLNRKAVQRNPLTPDFIPLFKRRWREAATTVEALKHLPRGHNASIHVKYPNFKEAVQAITHDLNGRTDKGRNSATVYLGNSTWSTIADRLGDSAYMSTLGGVIPVSVSALKKHKYRSARSRQQHCSEESGQLNVSHRKVAKLLMPTAVEQPNGHMMNLTIKELERFGMLNSYYIDLVNRYASRAAWCLRYVHSPLTSPGPTPCGRAVMTRPISSWTTSIVRSACCKSCFRERVAASSTTTANLIVTATNVQPRRRRTTM